MVVDTTTEGGLPRTWIPRDGLIAAYFSTLQMFTPCGQETRHAASRSSAAASFTPYRRLWAIERKHLPDHDVAAGGGWTDTQALRLIYQRATPEGVLKAVIGE